MLLDEVVLEQQRFGLGVGDGDFDVGDLLDERRDPRFHLARTEVRAHTVLEAARLADVQDLAFAAVHAIDAGPARQRRHQTLEAFLPCPAGLAHTSDRLLHGALRAGYIDGVASTP